MGTLTTWGAGVHPAADLFPMLDDDDLQALADDIAVRGLLEPVWVLPDGRLLDGRNRVAACAIAGIDPERRTYTGDDPTAFVVSLNIHRRHLTTGQKALLALEVLSIYEAETKDRGGRPRKAVNPNDASANGVRFIAGDDRPDLRERAANRRPEGKGKPRADLPAVSKDERRTRHKAAKVTGTSGRAVSQAKRIAEHAPDLAEKVKAGDLALDKAEKQLRRRQSEKEEQQARAAKLAPVAVDAEGDRWRMFSGDFRERLSDLPDGCVDLIVTDPPYPGESLPLWSDLAKHAARLLRPQGILVGLTGQIYLPDVMNRLGEHLQYGWVYCQPLPGSNSRIMARHALQAWKPWVAYSNGAWPSGRIDWHEDVLTPSDRTKSRYRWEQDGNPSEYLIEALCPEGGTVLDPFTGTGTYGLAALARGRHFIGCEMDADRFTGTVERLATT